MKRFIKKCAALLAAVSLLLTQAPLVQAREIEIETKFDYVMQFIEWFSLDGENQDVLRAYFNQYLEENPDAFVDLVHDIVQSIDPYSMYFAAEEYSSAYSSITSYVGIGVTISYNDDGLVYVKESYRNGPAYESGIRAGDLFVSVDDTAITDAYTIDMVAELCRGEAGSSVSVTVRRAGRELTYEVERRQVNQEHVSNETLAPGVEYIAITAMGSETDLNMFKEIWSELHLRDTKSVILDVRGNGGGLMNVAQEMIEIIVPDEDKVYLRIRNREDEGGIEELYTPGGGFKLNSLIILTDGKTASAAEVLAGSLSDLKVATLLGEKTYGKGVGQYHFTMPDGSMLVLTAIEMLLPYRGSYNGIGIEPDILIAKTGETMDYSGLTALDTTQALFPGQSGKQVKAMTERLAALGLMEEETDTFSADVLVALQDFQKLYGLAPTLMATVQTLEELDIQAKAELEAMAEMDIQLAYAYEMALLAAEKDPQYTVLPDGSWFNH